MVMTDWWNHAEMYKEIEAGNDIHMPESQGKDALVLKKLKNGELDRGTVEVCVKHILEMIMKLD